MKKEAIHPSFLELNQLVFTPSYLKAEKIQVEEESQEYGALNFELAGKKITYRVGKTTPKKVGPFVTLWKRVKGIIIPYDSADTVDCFMVAAREEDKHGFFYFPKSVLAKKGITSNKGEGGKRGFRIYPPWALMLNQQAKRTQSWQVEFFHEVSSKSFEP